MKANDVLFNVGNLLGGYIKVTVAYFKLSQHLPGEREEEHKTHASTYRFDANIRTRDLLITTVH
jgi:hypothetical protein